MFGEFPKVEVLTEFYEIVGGHCLNSVSFVLRNKSNMMCKQVYDSSTSSDLLDTCDNLCICDEFPVHCQVFFIDSIR